MNLSDLNVACRSGDDDAQASHRPGDSWRAPLRRGSLVMVPIGLALLAGACALADDEVMAGETVATANEEITVAAESIAAVVGDATSVDGWDLVACTERMPRPFRANADRRIGIRAMGWTGVSEADARPLLEDLDVSWKESDTPFVMRSSDDRVLFVGGSFSGGNIAARYERDIGALWVEVYTNCSYTDTELLEAIDGK